MTKLVAVLVVVFTLAAPTAAAGIDPGRPERIFGPADFSTGFTPTGLVRVGGGLIVTPTSAHLCNAYYDMYPPGCAGARIAVNRVPGRVLRTLSSASGERWGGAILVGRIVRDGTTVTLHVAP